MTVTAKFKVASVIEGYEGQRNIRLMPDYNDERNKAWSRFTPAGLIELTVLESVAESFPLWQNFLVTFEPEA